MTHEEAIVLEAIVKHRHEMAAEEILLKFAELVEVPIHTDIHAALITLVQAKMITAARSPAGQTLYKATVDGIEMANINRICLPGMIKRITERTNQND